MKKRYRSLLLTDEWEIIKRAGEIKWHVVPCLPVVFEDEAVLQSEVSGVIGLFPYVLTDVGAGFENADPAFLDVIDARLCGYPLEILRTERCIVREIRVEDVPKLYEIYKEPEITRYMEDLYEDPREEIKYTEDYIKWHYGLYGFGMWIVTDMEGRITGRAGFDQKQEDEPYLGFMIRKDMQRQGLAYEVCDALMKYAAGNINIGGIRSLVHSDNIASGALLQKLGFEHIGRQDGMELYLRRL